MATNQPVNNPPDPQVPSDAQTTTISINTQPDPLSPALDGYNSPPTDAVPANEFIGSPKPIISNAVFEAQSSSLTPIGSAAPLISDAVTSAQAASGSGISSFVGEPKPVISDAVANAQESSNTDSSIFNGNPTNSDQPQSTAMVGVMNAQQQPSRSAVQGVRPSSNDWRFRVSLAPSANYLYMGSNPGILSPLQATGGVLYPYTPKIEVGYKANYSAYELTHSNYKGYYYKNSSVDAITITGHFTAQNTTDANYLLAVIQFYKSVTKMFYGQDAQRGTPPPLVYLTGFGTYQFNNHPGVVQSFTYSLPDEVDYIRADTVNQAGSAVPLGGLTGALQNLGTPGASAIVSRLTNVGATVGAVSQAASLFGIGGKAKPPVSPTYVPTKMDITVSILPIISRKTQSTEWSLDQFASGAGITKGWW